MKRLFFIPVFFLCMQLNAQECFSDCKTLFKSKLKKVFNQEMTYEEAMDEYHRSFIGCAMPEFEALAINGELVSSKKLLGSPIVLNFWFMNCAPCVAEIPALNKLVDEFAKDGVKFVGFTIDENVEDLKEFNQSHEFKFQIVPISKEVVNEFCIMGWPTSFLIDRSGQIVNVFAGGKTDESARTYAYEKIKDHLVNCLK